MNYNSEIDDELLLNVLYRTGIAPESLADSDEADELFALLIEKGGLEDFDREQFLRCLDANSTARRAVSQYMHRVAGNPALSRMPEVAAAAPCATPSALSRIGQWATNRLTDMAQLTGKLTGSSRVTAPPDWQPQAAHVGGQSIAWAFPFAPRLAMACATLLLFATIGVLWVAWQPASRVPLVAMRGGPNLMDYGYNLDAIGMKGDESPPAPDIQSLLATIPIEDRKLIEEGFAHLQKNEIPDALASFGQPLSTPVGRYYGQLGTATALYMQHQYEAAKSAFETALDSSNKSESNATAAKVGLAMTLTRLGQDREALDLWQQVVHDEHLPKEQRTVIAGQIARLTQTKPN